MAAQLTSDVAAQPDSGTASAALALGELDITSTEVSLKGASRLAVQGPGGSHVHRHSQPALMHTHLRLRVQAWRPSWSSMPSTRFCGPSSIRAAIPGNTGGSTRRGCGRRSWSRIQDYLAESDNLVLLHEQARPWTALVCWWWCGLLQASLVPTGAA